MDTKYVPVQFSVVQFDAVFCKDVKFDCDRL